MTEIPIPEPPKSILLIRLTARGDVVFSSPMVRALRRTYPDARISWLGEAHTVELIEHHPELNRVFPWDRKRWKELLRKGKLRALSREITTFIGALRAEKFDLSIDMQGFLRSGLMAFLSGARTRIVLRPKEGSHHFAHHAVDRYLKEAKREEICSHYRFLARRLGLGTDDFQMEVPLHPTDRSHASDIIKENRLGSGYAVVIPYTTRPQKHWFEDRWASLMDQLKTDAGLHTVILGGPSDLAADARLLAQTTTADPVSLTGKTTLRQAAAIIEKADLVIGVDTGLTHIGIAFDRPTIGIYGANIPYTETFTDRTRLLIHRLDCVPCEGNPTCDGDFTCMRLISVDGVMEATRDLLQQSA